MVSPYTTINLQAFHIFSYARVIDHKPCLHFFAGNHACSDLSELAETCNDISDSHAIENHSSEDENGNDFSKASEVTFQGEGNSAPEGAISPNPLNEVDNPSGSCNGKPIVKEETRSRSLSLTMSEQSELNQPINPYPTMNKSFPDHRGTEGHYRIIDDAFSPASEHMNTVFVTDCRECDRI